MAGNVPDLGETALSRIVQAIRELFEGRSNAVGTVTLTAGAASTVVTSETCGDESVVVLSPLTANAAAALGTTSISVVTNGSFTIAHANNAQTDRSFGYVAIG
jgi:hypothetical protein